MKEREHPQCHLFARRRLGVPEAVHVSVGDEVSVGQHRALGKARGAAGVLQEGQIGLGIDRRLPCGRSCALQEGTEMLDGCALRQRRSDIRAGLFRLRDRQPKLELSPLRQVIDDGSHNDVLHGSAGPDLRHVVVDTVETDHHLGTAIGQLMAQLSLGVERVVFDDHGAEPQRGEESDDVLWAVGQHEGHAIALGHSQSGERRGESVDLPLEFLVRQLRSEEGQRDVVREGGGCVVEESRQGERRELVVGRDPDRVAGKPRAVSIPDRRLKSWGRRSSRAALRLPGCRLKARGLGRHALRGLCAGRRRRGGCGLPGGADRGGRCRAGHNDASRGRTDKVDKKCQAKRECGTSHNGRRRALTGSLLTFWLGPPPALDRWSRWSTATTARLGERSRKTAARPLLRTRAEPG